MKTLIKSILLLPLVVYITACGESGGKGNSGTVANANYVRDYNGQCVHRTTGQIDYTGTLCGGAAGTNGFQLINGICYQVLPTQNIPAHYCQNNYNPSYLLINGVCRNVQQAAYTSCQGGQQPYPQPYPNPYPQPYPQPYPYYPQPQPQNCFYLNIGGFYYYQCQ